jgi:hypothetical protein
MALLLPGKTICAICRETIQDGEDAESFPHLIVNAADELHPLSDASCHKRCVSSSAIGMQMRSVFSDYQKRAGPGNRQCAVCGKQVLDRDDYVMIGYLCDPVIDPLGRFNYTHLHRSHARDWEGANAFTTLADATLRAGRWQGEDLIALINLVKR